MPRLALPCPHALRLQHTATPRFALLPLCPRPSGPSSFTHDTTLGELWRHASSCPRVAPPAGQLGLVWVVSWLSCAASTPVAGRVSPVPGLAGPPGCLVHLGVAPAGYAAVSQSHPVRSRAFCVFIARTALPEQRARALTVLSPHGLGSADVFQLAAFRVTVATSVTIAGTVWTLSAPVTRAGDICWYSHAHHFGAPVLQRSTLVTPRATVPCGRTAPVSITYGLWFWHSGCVTHRPFAFRSRTESGCRRGPSLYKVRGMVHYRSRCFATWA